MDSSSEKTMNLKKSLGCESLTSFLQYTVVIQKSKIIDLYFHRLSMQHIKCLRFLFANCSSKQKEIYFLNLFSKVTFADTVASQCVLHIFEWSPIRITMVSIACNLSSGNYILESCSCWWCCKCQQQQTQQTKSHLCY